MTEADDTRSIIRGEEIFKVAIGQGIYTSELPSNIPDGFCQSAYNLVATGDSMENRIGLRPSSVDYHKNYFGIPFQGITIPFTPMSTRDETMPALGWAATDVNGIETMSFIRGPNVSGGAGDGYMEVSMPDSVVGIAQYGQLAYFSMIGASNGIYRITGYNWVADSISYVSIPSSAAVGISFYGLFSFKDRLWAYTGDRIYFTEIAPVAGTGPEAWSSTNYVSFRSATGISDVIAIIPVSNKLLVFTRAGLYTLLVQGAPSSWILRLLDSSSISTYTQCAFESKGIVYYVNSSGVWATNGTQVTKLSGVIEDKFFLAKGQRFHNLFEYEDGMILSISKILDDGRMDSESCVNFYSKMEPIAWTEWGIHPPEGETNNFGINRLCGFISVSKKIPTHLSADPTVYALALISDSKSGAVQGSKMNLLIFDGGENKMRNRAGDLITDPLRVAFKSKYLDCGNAYALKENKEGMLELFTSDSRHMFSCSWDLDSTVGANSRVSGVPNFNDLSSGRSSNLIRIPSQFKFRRCAFSFSSSLQTNTSQIKIKDLALRYDTERPEFELVR